MFRFTVWLHVPVGILNAAMLYFSPPAGVLFGAGFVAYEITPRAASPTSISRDGCGASVGPAWCGLPFVSWR